MKKKFSAKKGARVTKYFRWIQIDGDLHYCLSHNFFFNVKEHEELLYNGKPCIYTDNRYYVSSWNSFRRANIPIKNGTPLKTCLRKINRAYNIPKGTTVNIVNRYVGLDVDIVVKNPREKTFDFDINKESYNKPFNNDSKLNDLIQLLRENGFIVSVGVNSDYLTDMISTASVLTGGEPIEKKIYPESVAFAYGHGKRIGFSENKGTLNGYSCGEENILWDWWDEFNKWSQCYEISKDTPNEKILEILLKSKSERES